MSPHLTASSSRNATAPSERLAGFAALLRDHGLTVGVAEQQAMLQAALYFGPLHERPLQAAWRAIACHSQREWQLWPDVYERFWHPEKLRGGVKVSGIKDDPKRLMAHLYVRHMGDLAGGQMIAKRIPGSGKMYQFTDPDALKTAIRERLDDSMADEAKVCFKYAEEMFKDMMTLVETVNE